MRKSVFLCGIFAMSFLITYANDSLHVMNTVEQLFEKMKTADTLGFRNLFTESPLISSVPPSGLATDVKKHGLDEWIGSINRHLPGELNEQWSVSDVNCDGSLAHVWMPYVFYYKGAFSHCGKNSFQLMRLDGQWKICSIVDTRYPSCLKNDLESSLDSIVNAWHQAASTGDEYVFFETMKPGGIYIGTDPTELWTAEEMEIWANKYFQRDTAWHFTPLERHWYFSEAGDMAWFDELLDTWMGVCRASGVMEKRSQQDWQLRHYHLSVTVLNEKMDELLKIKGIK